MLQTRTHFPRQLQRSAISSWDTSGALGIKARAGECRSRAAERPLDRTQEMCLEAAICPDAWPVAERRRDDPGAAIGLRPRQRVIASGAPAMTDLDGAGIEPQQDVDRRPR